MGSGLLLEKGEAVHEGWVEGCSLGRDARWGSDVHIGGMSGRVAWGYWVSGDGDPVFG